VLYVSVHDSKGKIDDVTNVVTNTWSDHWKASNEQVESHVFNNDDLEMYSGKTLYVWEGNNEILAWMSTILMIRGLHPTNFVGSILEAMHNVNRYIILTSFILCFFFINFVHILKCSIL
jgi:hypothetical protein